MSLRKAINAKCRECIVDPGITIESLANVKHERVSTKAFLIYDENSNRTIGVLSDDGVPYIPTDPLSNYLVGEAEGLGHAFKIIPTDWTYSKALKLFRESKPGDLDIVCRTPPDRDMAEKDLKATDRIYRTQAIPDLVKERVIRLWATGKGKSQRRISREVGIALSTVHNIIKKETSRHPKSPNLGPQ